VSQARWQRGGQPHLNVIVESRHAPIFSSELEEVWRTLVPNGRCPPTPDDWRRKLSNNNVYAVAEYIFKAGKHFPNNTIYPRPGALSATDLATLLDGVKGHRVFIRQGYRVNIGKPKPATRQNGVSPVRPNSSQKRRAKR
jgi:hypothetical protein